MTKYSFARNNPSGGGPGTPLVIESNLPDHDFDLEFDIPPELAFEKCEDSEPSAPRRARSQPIDWLALAKQYKDRGNSHFRVQEDSSPAIYLYKKALHCLRRVPRASTEVQTLRVTLYVNLCACDLTVQDYAACRRHASKALKHDEFNVKALYRRSVARRYAGFDLQGAENDLVLAVEHSVSAKEAEPLKRALEALRRDRAKSQAQAKDVAKRMFGA